MADELRATNRRGIFLAMPRLYGSSLGPHLEDHMSDQEPTLHRDQGGRALDPRSVLVGAAASVVALALVLGVGLTMHPIQARAQQAGGDPSMTAAAVAP